MRRRPPPRPVTVTINWRGPDPLLVTPGRGWAGVRHAGTATHRLPASPSGTNRRRQPSHRSVDATDHRRCERQPPANCRRFWSPAPYGLAAAQTWTVVTGLFSPNASVDSAPGPGDNVSDQFQLHGSTTGPGGHQATTTLTLQRPRGVDDYPIITASSASRDRSPRDAGPAGHRQWRFRDRQSFWLVDQWGRTFKSHSFELGGKLRPLFGSAPRRPGKRGDALSQKRRDGRRDKHYFSSASI